MAGEDEADRTIKTTDETYTIRIGDFNDAPTGADFMPSTSFSESVNIGNVVAEDDDRLTVDSTGAAITRTGTPDSWTYELVTDTDPRATDGKTTDTGLFTIVNANTGELHFKNAESTGAGLGDRKALGQEYEVRVLVTDKAGESITTTFRFTEGTVTIGANQYSDSALVDENANFAVLGEMSAGDAAIGFAGPATTPYTPVGAELAGIDSDGTILTVKDGQDYDSITVVFDVSSGSASTLAIAITGTTRDPIITFTTSDATITNATLTAAIALNPSVDAILSVAGGTSWTINADTTYTITPDNNNADFFVMTTAAAVTIGSSVTSTLDIRSATGSEFVVLVVNASNVVTGMMLKSTLAAGDLVIGRLNADATDVTYASFSGLTFAVSSNGNNLIMSGFATDGTTTIVAQKTSWFILALIVATLKPETRLILIFLSQR